MKNITIDHINKQIELNKDLPRKLRHWEVMKAEFERKALKEAQQ